MRNHSTIRVGVLHSLSGTMAEDETPLSLVAQMAIEEINESGGVLGKQVEAVLRDGASDPAIFANKARELLAQEEVETIFGCWTSSSRKAVRPVVEEHNSLLWYPVQYEGLEQSPNIIYTGSCLNQQIDPGIAWALSQGRRRCFLVGSDYIFPRTANSLIRALVSQRGGSVLDERYARLGSNDFSEIADAISANRPDIVFNTINGDSNHAFFRELQKVLADDIRCTVMSFSFSEIGLQEIAQAAVGHYACWSYFQSVQTPENSHFIEKYKRRFGPSAVVSDPIATAYTQVYLWKRIVEDSNSCHAQDVLSSVQGRRVLGPGGVMEIQANHHVMKHALIGQATAEGQFDVIWSSDRPIEPKPWLGVEDIELATRSLIVEALSQYPEVINLNVDLEDRVRERTDALNKANEELRLTQYLVDHSEQAAFWIELEGRIFYVNNAACRNLGYSQDELLNMSLADIDPDWQAETMGQHIAELKQQGTCSFESRHRRKDGTLFPILVAVSYGEFEGQGYISAFVTDVTERKRSEESLRRRESILQAVAYAAEHFLKTPSWEDDVDLILARLGQAAEVSRVYIFQNHTDAAGELLASQRYEWVAPGVTTQLDAPDMWGIPWRSVAMRRAAEVLSSGGCVSGHVRDFLPAEQEMMSALDIQSMVVVPIFARGEWWGFMGFDECVREREWFAAEIDALEAGASTLGAAIHRKRVEDALKKSEKRFRDITDNALEWIWEVDSNGKYTYVSPVIESILGYEPEEILQQYFYDFFYPDDKEELKRVAFEAFAGKKGFREFVNRNVHKNGKVVWLSTSGIPILDETGELVGYRGADTDITERKQAEDALRESASRLQLATAATRIGHWDWDLRTNEVYFSPEWKRQLGYESHEILNRFETWESRLHPDDLQGAIQAVEDYIAGRRADCAVEFRLRHKDGSYRWIYTRADKQFDDTGKPCRLFGCHVDITERKQAEQQVQAYQDRLRALAAELTLSEERERRRIATELHDGAAQSLAFARIQLASACKAVAETEAADKLDNVSQILRESLQQIRDVLLDLSSPSMNEIGLGVAISDWLAQQIGRRHGLRTSFADECGKVPLDDDVRAVLFRNTRELLANVVKHAGADTVSVRMESTGEALRITIEDDGAGFERDKKFPTPDGGGFGLFSIRERMLDLGGSLEIVSAPGKGCEATLVMPLDSGEERS